MSLGGKRNYYVVVASGYVFFERENKILLSRRYNTGYRDGQYSLPAGHGELGEFASATAIREAQEEVGIVIAPEDLRPVHIMHRRCGDHDRIDFFFVAKNWAGEIKNLEPERCDHVDWFPVGELPTNTVPYIRAAIEHYRAGRFYSEFAEIDNKIT